MVDLLNIVHKQVADSMTSFWYVQHMCDLLLNYIEHASSIYA